MQTRHLAILGVAAIVCLSFIPQIGAPNVSVDADRGWAGPHPSQLVRYVVQVPAGSWSTPVTVLPAVPQNGLVITEISAVTDTPSDRGELYQIRIVRNATTVVGQWGFGQSFRRERVHGGGNGLASSQTSTGPVESVRLGNGVAIANRGSLAIQAHSPRGLTVTLLGYTW